MGWRERYVDSVPFVFLCQALFILITVDVKQVFSLQSNHQYIVSDELDGKEWLKTNVCLSDLARLDQ